MAIRILCLRPGFRRAGVAHAADRTWPDGRFTEQQLDQLKAEPLLNVIEVPNETSNDGATGDPSGVSLSGGATVASQAGQHGSEPGIGGAETHRSQAPLNSEAAPGIAAGAPQGTAGSQTGASQGQGSSRADALGEAGKGAEGGATSSSAPATDTKPKGRKPSGAKAASKAAEK